MARIDPPPIYEKLLDAVTGKARLPWILFFDQVFIGDTGTKWVPTFTGLTTVGTPTITATYYKVSAALTYFSIQITPATSTSAVAGTTYCDFPLTITADGVCADATAGFGGSLGMAQAGSNRLFMPTWTGVVTPLVVCGTVEAR